MNKEIFEKYLQYRFERANAITPGQRLEVLEEVRADAQRGMVPIDENTMASLDLNDPAVQAVLRGENVSMGAHSAKRKRGKVPNSDRNKLFIVAAIVLVPILLALLFLGYRGRAKAAANAPTETPLASATPTTDPVMIAQQTLSAQATQTQAALMAEASPTLPPTETPPPQQVLYSSGIAADEPTAPASIEIAGRRFVVLEGQVDSKTGVWEPEGVEWLLDTAVRKVFAIPLEMLKDAQLTVGDPIYVRYRNGYTVTYALTQATDVIVDQIEILNSNKPSMVIIAYTGNFDDPHRLILVGEIPVPFQSRENAPAPTAIPGMRAVVIGDGVRLRQLTFPGSQYLEQPADWHGSFGDA